MIDVSRKQKLGFPAFFFAFLMPLCLTNNNQPSKILNNAPKLNELDAVFPLCRVDKCASEGGGGMFFFEQNGYCDHSHPFFDF